MVKSLYLYRSSPLPAGSIPAAADLSTLAAHERRRLSFQMSKADVVLVSSRNVGTQRGKMTRIHGRFKCGKCPNESRAYNCIAIAISWKKLGGYLTC